MSRGYAEVREGHRIRRIDVQTLAEKHDWTPLTCWEETRDPALTLLELELAFAATVRARR